MSFPAGVRSAVYAIIESATPTVTTIWDSDNANRYSWRELVENWEEDTGSREVQPPFAVCRWMSFEPSDKGPINGEVYALKVWMYFVTALRNTTTGAAKTQEELMAEIEDACAAWTTALRAYTSGNFTLIDQSFDTGDVAEINQYMLAKNLPFMCGAVGAELLVGNGV